MDAISLFSGAGGFEIGLERAGIRTVLQAENDPWALQVLARHWPDVERVTDVRSVGHRGEPASRAVAHELRARVEGRRRQAWAGLPGSVDLICGGFPCQDVSVAGNRAGFGGQRSSLWFEFRRVLSELRPQWCLIENVPGLLSSDGGGDMATILGGLGDLRYGWAYRVLDARWFGVPQRRRRVFIVGCLGNASRAAQVLAVCESCGGHPAPRREAGEDIAPTLDDGAHRASVELPIIAAVAYDDRNQATLDDIHHTRRGAGLQRSDIVAMDVQNCTTRPDIGTLDATSRKKLGSDWLIADPISAHEGKTYTHAGAMTADGYNPSMNSSTVSLLGAAGVRRLTPLECERLMGWPDNWTRYTADGKEIPDGHRYRLCGNGVVSTVAEWIGHRLMWVDQHLEGTA